MLEQHPGISGSHTPGHPCCPPHAAEHLPAAGEPGYPRSQWPPGQCHHHRPWQAKGQAAKGQRGALPWHALKLRAVLHHPESP